MEDLSSSEIFLLPEWLDLWKSLLIKDGFTQQTIAEHLPKCKATCSALTKWSIMWWGDNTVFPRSLQGRKGSLQYF